MNLHTAIPVLAGIYSERYGIKVEFGERAETDGRTIFLPRNTDDQALTLTYLAHECSHILYSDFNNIPDSDLHMHIANIIEDYRIEKLFVLEFPGLLNDFSKTAADFTENDGHLRDPLGVILSYIWQYVRIYLAGYENRYPDQLNLISSRIRNEYGQEFLDDLTLILDKSKSAGNESTVFEISREIINLLKQEDEKNEEPNGSENAENGESEGSDDTNNNQDSDESDSSNSEKSEDDESDNDNCESKESSNEGSDDDENQQNGTQSSEQSDDKSDEDSAGGSSGDDAEDDSDESNSSNAKNDSKGQSDDSDGDNTEEKADGDANGNAKNGSSSKGQDLKFNSESFEGGSGDIGDLIADKINENLPSNQSEPGHPAAPETELPNALDDLITNNNVCQSFLQTANTATSYLRQSVRRILEDKVKSSKVAKRHGKRLYRSRLAKIAIGDTKIFAKKIQEVEGFDAFVSVLTDASGSMGQNVGFAKQATYSLLATLDSIEGVSTSAHAFGTNSESGISVLKKLNERVTGKVTNRIAAILAKGSTPAYSAYWAAIHQLVAAKKANNMIVMVTDGVPNDIDSTKRVVNLLKKNGVKVLCLGVGGGFNVNVASEIYGQGNYVHINAFDELPTRLLGVTKTMLLN